MLPWGLDYLFHIPVAVRFNRATNSGLQGYIHHHLVVTPSFYKAWHGIVSVYTVDS